MGAGNRVTSCDLDIFADQSAEPILAQNAHTGHFYGWVDAPGGRVLLQCPVRPVGVVVLDVLAQELFELPAIPAEGAVQELAAHAADPTFRKRVRAGCAVACG